MPSERAENSLNEAIKLDPHFDPATFLLAELKIGKGTRPPPSICWRR